MGFETIGEGIETADQLEALRSLGCVLGQGYHIGRPASEPATRALIAAGPMAWAGGRAATLRLASNE
jgi:EAL domain-containing protein (putative c-di-GMP-specific phosphodiesterase class I)